MKKFGILILLIFILAACNRLQGAEYSPFFPFMENLVLVYEMEGPGFTTDFTTFNSFVRENRMQRLLIMHGGGSMVEVIEMIDGRVVYIIGRSEADGISPYIDITDENFEMFYVIFPDNLELGTRWRSHPLNEGSRAVKEITGVDVRISTPAGTFNTIEITSTGQDDGDFHVEPVTRAFFAEGIGMVKQIHYGGIPAHIEDLENFEQGITTTMLTEISHDGLRGYVPAFHVDAEGNVPQIPIVFTTNNDLTALYSDLLARAALAVFRHELADDFALNSYFLNPNNQNLHLDFSAGFLREMQAVRSAEAEERILAAIVDIFATLFNARGVTITVDGQPYEGPFIAIRSMEFWSAGASTPHLPRYAPADIAAAMAILRDLHGPYVDIMSALDPAIWDYFQFPADSRLQNMQDIFDEFNAVFGPQFIAGFLEPMLFHPDFPAFSEEDGQIVANLDNFFIENFSAWWQWSPEDAEISEITPNEFVAEIGDITLVFVLTEDGWRIEWVFHV
ncbi:MAG: GerMN domain-containing protein [Clostridiales bacterium]|jgi:hypothetical protein|nr:GerMN domain-containing protein [Clostridiales bacterium]